MASQQNSGQQPDKPETYSEWASRNYAQKRDEWKPWVEDMYLRWFGKDNKASYVTRQQLDRTKVTNIEQVNNLQDGVNNLVSSQIGQGGLAQPIGDLVSKEGINRAQRGGKDEHGNRTPSQASGLTDGAAAVGSTVGQNAQNAGKGVVEGAKGIAGQVGGIFGGGGSTGK